MFNKKFDKREKMYLSAMVEDQMKKVEILVGSIPEDDKESVERIAVMYAFLQKLRDKI